MRMRYEDILGVEFDCACGRRHEVPVRRVVYAEDALGAVGEVLGDVAAGRRVAVIADERTWAVAGEACFGLLEEAGWRATRVVLPDTEGGGPVCDDATFARLKEQVPPVEVVLAVGCGVINDLSKWLAFERRIPYAVVGTAATMNGFAAANIAATLDGVKTVLFARALVAVFAVPSIIRQAPYELTTAGLGDVIAKPVSTADWMMNHEFCGEYFCRYCSEMINDLEPAYFDNPQAIKSGSPEAIAALFNALVWSGIAMTVVGTSAPASGGEHMLSHTLDMMSSVDGAGHDLHGRQVGLGTIFACALYERIAAIERPECVEMPGDIDAAFWGPLAANVRGQYEAKKELMQTIRRQAADGKVWEGFRDMCRSQVRATEEVKHCLRRAGAASTFADIGCSRPRLRDAVLHMHEIRTRPTVVDLAWMTGILPNAADDLIDRWLTD